MRQGLRSTVSGCLLLVTLLSCSSSDDDQASGSQKYYFLESLQQVDEGGRQLQSSDLDQDELTRALATLDQGLRLAFQVEREFLDNLDLRLGKNYQRFFVKGIENYRLGIEAGDETQQRQGLQQLAKWAEFWNLEHEAIEAKLNTG